MIVGNLPFKYLIHKGKVKILLVVWCLLVVAAYATVQECYSIGHVSVHTQFTSLAVTLTGHDWLNQDHLQEKTLLKEKKYSENLTYEQLAKNRKSGQLISKEGCNRGHGLSAITTFLNHFLKTYLEEASLELLEIKPINPQSLFLDVYES